MYLKLSVVLKNSRLLLQPLFTGPGCAEYRLLILPGHTYISFLDVRISEQANMSGQKPRSDTGDISSPVPTCQPLFGE